MSRRHPVLLVLLAMLSCGGSAWACGEGAFNMGQGLSYQGYLAPRPATILVYDDGTSPKREKLYGSLTRAGHKLTVVKDPGALAAALRARHFDVAIAGFAQIATLDSLARQSSRAVPLLPVVPREARNEPQLRKRFRLFVLDGASLGQYLKAIHQLLPAKSA